MSTDKPDAGEPVEPSADDLYRRHRTQKFGAPLRDVFVSVFREGRSFERASRERKRGERPVCPYPLGTAPATVWFTAVGTIESWCNQGDSDELAKLRAELAKADEAIGRAKDERDCAVTKLREQDAIVGEMRAWFAGHKLAAGPIALDRLIEERDAEKARADRAESEHERTIEQRDKYHDAADELAYAIADEETIGEHSSANNPWERAIEALEVERSQVADRVSELEQVREANRRHADDLTQAKARIAELEAENVGEQDDNVALRARIARLAGLAERLSGAEAACDIEQECHRETDRRLTRELQSALSERDGWHAQCATQTERADALTRELAEAREELKLRDTETQCSFCFKNRSELKLLIQHGSVFICDECIPLCTEILDAHRAKTSGSAGSGDAAQVTNADAQAEVFTNSPQSAEPELPTQSPNSAEFRRGKRSGLGAARGYLFDEDGELHDPQPDMLNILLKEFDREIAKLESPSSADSDAPELNTALAGSRFGHSGSPPPYETAPTLTKVVTCEHRLWADGDDEFATGPVCGEPAEFLRCDPIDQPVCDAHKCRCKKPLQRVVRVESAPSKLVATLDRIEASPPRGRVTEADGPLFIPEPRPGFATVAELAEVVREMDRLIELVTTWFGERDSDTGQKCFELAAEIRAEREARKL